MTDTKDRAQENLREVHLPFGVYRHYKGGLYVLFATSVDESTLAPLVHYYSLEKKTRWTRTRGNFMERDVGSFDDHEVPRFTFVRPAETKELYESLGLSFLQRSHVSPAPVD
jgi:hypothetical protein